MSQDNLSLMGITEHNLLFQRSLYRYVEAELWEALELRSGQNFWVLAFDPWLSEQPQRYAALCHELDYLASLQHPHIFPILDRWENSHRQYMMTMEPLPDAMCLRQYPEKLMPRELLDLFSGLAELLDWFGQGGFYLDLRPDQIFLQPQPFAFRYLLLPKSNTATVGTQAGWAKTDPFYLSPEEASGQAQTQASGYFVLGSLLFEALVGQPAFAASSVGETLEMIRQGTSPTIEQAPIRQDVRDFLYQLWQVDPNYRLQDAPTIRAYLERIFSSSRSYATPSQQEMPRRESLGGWGASVADKPAPLPASRMPMPTPSRAPSMDDDELPALDDLLHEEQRLSPPALSRFAPETPAITAEDAARWNQTRQPPSAEDFRSYPPPLEPIVYTEDADKSGSWQQPTSGKKREKMLRSDVPPPMGGSSSGSFLGAPPAGGPLAPSLPPAMASSSLESPKPPPPSPAGSSYGFPAGPPPAGPPMSPSRPPAAMPPMMPGKPPSTGSMRTPSPPVPSFQFEPPAPVSESSGEDISHEVARLGRQPAPKDIQQDLDLALSKELFHPPPTPRPASPGVFNESTKAAHLDATAPRPGLALPPQRGGVPAASSGPGGMMDWNEEMTQASALSTSSFSAPQAAFPAPARRSSFSFGGFGGGDAKTAKEMPIFDENRDGFSPVSPAAASLREEEKLQHVQNKKPTETTIKVLRRKGVVRHYTQMNPGLIFPLLVSLVEAELYIKIPDLPKVQQAESENVLEIKETSPMVRLVPVLPGCIVSPPEVVVDVRQPKVDAIFWVAPISEGDLTRSARVEIWHDGVCKDTLPLPCVIRTQFLTKLVSGFSVVSAVGGAFLEAFVGKGNAIASSAGKVASESWAASLAREAVKLLSTSGLWLGVFFLITALLCYLWLRPKRGDVLEKFLTSEIH